MIFSHFDYFGIFVQDFNLLVQRILLFGLLLILVYLGFDVLKYFIVPVLWACIIAYMTWPIYKRILSFCGEQRPTLSATLMSLLLILVLGIPFTFAVFLLQQEGRHLYIDLQSSSLLLRSQLLLFLLRLGFHHSHRQALHLRSHD